MRDRAIRLVRQCLALAASTTHDGERESALARASELCRKYELDPTMFVLPEIAMAEQQPDDPVPEYSAEFWSEWEAYWVEAKEDRDYRGGRSIEELLSDPAWLEATARAVREASNAMAESDWEWAA